MKSSEKNNHEIDEHILELIQREPKYQDTYVKLGEARCIFLSEVFSKRVAAEVSAWLLYFNNENPKAPIFLYINSDGGDGAALTNIYDVIHLISAPVHTICIGKCYSAGAFILAAGAPGERYIYPHGQVMIHGLQCSILPDDQHNSKMYYKFLNNYNNKILGILAKHTKQPISKIKEDCKRDLYFDANAAIAYGIADYILV